VRPDRQIKAEVTGGSIYLPSKQATAFALVMNELIANALEHAFQFGRTGQLNINLAQEGNQVTVCVADNGRGLPPDFDSTRQSKLGLQIVQTLVEKDLAGTLRLENRPAGGSQAILTFYK
jgi:two-component sensor histidine kinase